MGKRQNCSKRKGGLRRGISMIVPGGIKIIEDPCGCKYTMLSSRLRLMFLARLILKLLEGCVVKLSLRCVFVGSEDTSTT